MLTRSFSEPGSSSATSREKGEDETVSDCPGGFHADPLLVRHSLAPLSLVSTRRFGPMALDVHRSEHQVLAGLPLRIRNVFKAHPILWFLLIIQIITGFDSVMLEYLASVHHLPVMFLPFHLQSDPVSANQFLIFAIAAIVYLGFLEWSIIEG